MKSRRICLDKSAAKEASFLIHVENSYASGKSKRPRGPRSSLTVLRPHFDLQTRALSYYLQYYLHALNDVPNLSRDLPECVSSWKISGSKSSMVDLALSSMALAVYSRTQQHPPAAAEASSRYYRLLRVAQERIAQLANPTLDEQNIEACLLAVSLMGRYECAMRRPGDTDSKDSFTSIQRWCHHDGAVAILKVWNDNPSRKPGTFIVKQIRRGLIKSSILRNLPLPDWLLDGNHFGEQEPELDYDRIVVRVVNLHHASTNLLQEDGLQILNDEKLSNEAREIEKALQEWLTNVPTCCSPQRQILPKLVAWPRKHFYSSIVYNYIKPGFAAVWCQLFAVRMLISNARLRVLDMRRRGSLVDLTYEAERLECITQLEDMADSLASSIPFCLERLKVDVPTSPNGQTSITLNTNDEITPYLAGLVVWPLTIASRLERIDVRNQLWFRSELAILGRIIGDGVLEYAETDQWAIL